MQMKICLGLVWLMYVVSRLADSATTNTKDTSLTNVENSVPEHIIGDSMEDNEIQAFVLVRSTGESEYRMFMDSTSTLTFNYSIHCKNIMSRYTLGVIPNVSKVLSVSKASVNISCANSVIGRNRTSNLEQMYIIDGTFNVTIKSGVIGQALMEFSLNEIGVNNMTSFPVLQTYDVIVIRKLRPVDTIFRLVVYCVQILVLTGFGAELDFQVVKDTLRKPVAPAIGFCCQYLMMPLIAFGVAKLATQESTVALGIFVSGCCPGGGNSNMYTYLLNGDLSLSITMTTISTVAALAMLPAWIYSLGSTFIADKSVSIPFSSVAISLGVLLVPLTAGVFLRAKCPKMAAKLQKALKPVIVVAAVILISVGVYSNLFIFRLFEPQIVLAACLLPYIGYLIGGVVSTVFRQPWKRIKTIIIETGMQNSSIAYILLTTSFMPPFGDLAAVAPVASAVMTPLPPFLITVCYLIYQKCKKKYEPVKQEGDDLQDNPRQEKTKSTNGTDSKTEDRHEINEKLTAI